MTQEDDQYQAYLKAKETASIMVKSAESSGLLNFDTTDGEHHPKTLQLYYFIDEVNFKHQGDSLGLKSGGDGDNGEELMNAMDAFFNLQDMLKGATPCPVTGC